MKNIDRRIFIQSAFALAGAPLLPALDPAMAQSHTMPLSWATNTEDYWEIVKQQFSFQPGLYYFNNGSIGPTPTSVHLANTANQKLADAFPSKYMWGDWDDEMETVRQQVAGLFSVSPEEIALIHNTTEGMNLIARSFELQTGDEIILADHEHTSGTIPWQVWQQPKGVKLVRPILPLLPKSKEEIVDIYKKAISPRTKLISMCHMVNTNGMILPVKEISDMAHQRGIRVAVDGAQAAGMLSVNLRELDCDFYAASAHKWLFGPKGMGILYSKQESQHLLKPLIVCNGHTNKTIRRLENYNTRNLPEALALGTALEFHALIGDKKIHERSLELKNYFRTKIETNPRLIIKTPAPDDLSSAIQVVEVIGKNVNEMKEKLFADFNIDCRPMSTFGLNGLRISLAIYLTKQDIDYLVSALETVAA